MPATLDCSQEAAQWKLDLLIATVLENQYIPQEPTEKQADFLTTPEFEVLYGGAARGAKSSGLLMAALQFVQIPGYSAILFRKTFQDLTLSDALIPRSHQWLGGKASWSDKTHTWTFRSGATLSFGYLDSGNDHYRYQGARYQFIGVDELTQHEEYQYRYLSSRLSRPAGSCIPLRLRATACPGGRGHEWVKKRFILNPKDRRFIRARLIDNPHEDCEAYIKSLAPLDPITRAQLLEGDWEAYQGGRFQRAWLARRFHRVGDYYVLEGRRYGTKDISIFQTCDHAATVQRSLKDDPDWTVISTWGVTPGRELLWLDCERFRAELPDVLARVHTSYKSHVAAFIAIEGGGTQKGLAQLARRLGVVVKDYLPGNKDKLQRAMRAVVLAESGRVYLPEAASWVEMAEGELLRFTGDPKRDSHDDIVDSFSIAADVMPMVEQARHGGVPYAMER